MPTSEWAANLRTMFPKVATGVATITGHAGRGPAKVDTAMLSPIVAEPLAQKALLLQSAIAGLIASHEVEPQLACALDELADEVTAGLLDVVTDGPVMPTAGTPDILVGNHGSILLLRPATPVGRTWLEAKCDRTGYQPFACGTLLCEPRYVADIVAGARQAGLEVS